MNDMMESGAQFLINATRASMQSLMPAQRSEMLDMVLNAFTRLGVEHLPAAEVAAKLRALAEAIESG